MASERDDSLQSINVRLNGKNYSYWSYVMKNFLRGKKLWGYVSGTHCKPIETNNEKYEEQLDSWEVCNSKIITWINNSVENSIGMQLAKYDTAKEVWEHLGKLYNQSNFARQYQLEMDIRSLNQKDMSIQEFYTSMTDLWDQLALTESIELRAFAPYIARREEQRLVQFLMALRDDFEGLRGNILHRNPLPSVDSVVSELLAEEIRHKSGTIKGTNPALTQSVLATHSPQSVLAAHSRPQQRSHGKPPSHNQNRNPVSDSSICNYCKQPGHWKAQCPELANKAHLTPPPSGRTAGHTPPNFGQNQSYRHPKPPNTAAVTPDSTQINSGTSSVDDLFEKFQKFINQQSQAMSAAAGLPTSSSAGSTFQEADWDRQ